MKKDSEKKMASILPTVKNWYIFQWDKLLINIQGKKYTEPKCWVHAQNLYYNQILYTNPFVYIVYVY